MCNDCNTNPALNDDSMGIKWIQGGVIKNHPCGCQIEGRGFCNYPLHIHYCPKHANTSEMVELLKQLRDFMESALLNSPHVENLKHYDAQIARVLQESGQL